MNNDFHTQLPCSQRGSVRLGLFDGFSRWFVFLGFTALVSCGTSKLFKELGAEQNEISRETTRFAGMTRKEERISGFSSPQLGSLTSRDSVRISGESGFLDPVFT